MDCCELGASVSAGLWSGRFRGWWLAGAGVLGTFLGGMLVAVVHQPKHARWEKADCEREREREREILGSMV